MNVAIFDVQAMRRDFKQFGRGSKDFFLKGEEAFARMERNLIEAVQKAAIDPDRSFAWSTQRGSTSEEEPFVTKESNKYRNETTGAKGVDAEIVFALKGSLDTDKRRVIVKQGFTGITFRRSGQSAKVVHFDIHGPASGSVDGHPAIHFQVIGGVNDIPRLQTYLLHPIDVIEFALMELFQSTWREHRLGSSCRSAVASYQADQVFRFDLMLRWMSDRVGDGMAPLLALQKQPNQPFMLHARTS